MNNISKILFATIILLFTASTLHAKDIEKPNILFIFADDQAFDTIRELGNKEIETPNLDKLVRNGTTFTHAYNMGSWSGAVCVASRHMLITGRFVWEAQKASQRPKEEVAAERLWPQYLSKSGYETYFSGKWHIRAKAEEIFDHVVHVRPGMPNQTPEGYNRPIEGQPDVWKPWDTRFDGFWKDGKHWSEVLGDDAESYLANAKKSNKPFFMYLAFNAPHDPRQSPKEYVEKYPLDKISMPENFLPEYPYNDDMKSGRKLRDERLAPFPRTEYAVKVNRQEYYSIITHMDYQIGRILDALEKTGKADNTYIFFTADHGLACGQHGLMGKQNPFDHSTRVPFIVVGPNVEKNKRIDSRIYLQDVMPTSLELAGVEKPQHVDFHSLLPILKDNTKANYKSIYGSYLDAQRSVTMGNFKLIVFPKINKTLLFNLNDDPKEMNDLSGQEKYQKKIKRLTKELLRLQKETGDELKLPAEIVAAK